MSDPAAPTTGPALLSIAVQVLQQLEQHQRSLVEHQRVVATQQAALLEQQHLIFTQQAALIEQQRIIAVTAVRAEIRACNGTCGIWRPLPLASGDPFPEDRIKFPTSNWSLREMRFDGLVAVGDAYGISAPDETSLRAMLSVFLAGVRINS